MQTIPAPVRYNREEMTKWFDEYSPSTNISDLKAKEMVTFIRQMREKAPIMVNLFASAELCLTGNLPAKSEDEKWN